MTNPFLALVIVLVAMLAIGNWLRLVGILCELQARLLESRFAMRMLGRVAGMSLAPHHRRTSK